MGTNSEVKASYFYVLHCNDGTLYGGYTTNLERRLKEHNDGVGAKYTRIKKRRPLRMIYAEPYRSRSEATKAEAAFKKQTRAQKNKYLIQQGVKEPLKEQHICVIREESKEHDKHSEKL